MNLDEVNVKLDEILEKIDGADIGIDLPFSSSFVLGAANFATSYQYVYAEKYKNRCWIDEVSSGWQRFFAVLVQVP